MMNKHIQRVIKQINTNHTNYHSKYIASQQSNEIFLKIHVFLFTWGTRKHKITQRNMARLKSTEICIFL